VLRLHATTRFKTTMKWRDILRGFAMMAAAGFGAIELPLVLERVAIERESYKRLWPYQGEL